MKEPMRQLKRVELGSNCCWATVIDPGNTGEWLCSECKEHCGKAVAQEVSVMVMDFYNGRVHHHVLTNDGDQDDVAERVEERVHKTYWNDCEFMYSAEKYLEFLDHSLL